ncbi:putative deferrochelatase/peroxidase YfeX [Mycobacterium pseudokansasii]|uniref:Putative deferrochelatase/peroxidase YfeX n=2 Tax=Mycobacterium pseudokansasii TaxID=2341080 RepID=A0A498QYA3_9MYCO|nr:putative deferrochelatase/peroxidase YfeX [Mycobacterium pseudokansasii]VBA33524.1 putative deferrochelatase/peroxidase YfeX [Mycobacterium pseudokansasii]VBA55221.1 putative deferrochelatase/peroxidase YfeX [Mycobacterium pseudokansasii]
MNSQRPRALAVGVGPPDMHTIMAVGDQVVHARVGRVPPVQPQPILAPLTPAAIFLVAIIDDGGETAVHDGLADISGLVRAIGFRDPGKNLSAVTSIGSHAWDRLFSGPRPAKLHPFVALHGPRHTAPATPGDLLFHIRAETMDVCFELAGRILSAMAGAVTVVDEVHGFRFFDNRDLLGFVDGTENPSGPIAVSATAVGDEDPEFAGGCYVHVQKYVHDMRSWDSLSVTEQEQVIGRTKLEDIELGDDVKPANSHIALNVITDDDGTELKIVRHNMPFGKVGTSEYGTYFIGYSRAPEVTEQMLHNMFLGDPPGNTDRILDFSTAVTGGLFFSPTVDFLDDPPPLPQSPAPAPAAVPAPDDGSLSIGSLKGTSR